MASLVNRCVSVVVRNNNHHNKRFFHHLFKKSPGNSAKRLEPLIVKELCLNSVIGNEICNRSFTVSSTLLKKARVNVTFVKTDGQKITGTGREGDTLLDVVVNNDLDLKGYGACEGTLSCSTCHLIFKDEDFSKLEEKATDEELDMLDLAIDACSTSRLGCQVCVTKDMEGLVVKVPADVRDARGSPETTESVTS